jgi:hypothetical protein
MQPVADVTAADADARAGLWLAVVGAGLLPITVIAVGLVPEGARWWVLLVGLSMVATLSIRGGLLARRALVAGTVHRARAIVGAVLGLLVGATAAMLAAWAFVGLVL